MATIGVLTYTLPPGLKLKNTFNKIPLGNNNIVSVTNQNSVVTKLENIGMIGGEVLVVRKKAKVMPLLQSTVANIQQPQQPQQQLQSIQRPQHPQPQQQPPAKRVKLLNGEVQISCSKKSTPQPQAVARRNARERKRVKQVNDGFTALRQHIPEEVASAFEAAGNGRGTSKKLSKVETLRMAVEYIRSLERLLEIDIDHDNLDATTPVIKSESCSSSIDDHCSESNFDPDESTIYFTDTLPDITTVNGQQYLRIPGTNTYQLITADVFDENEENIMPLAVTCGTYPRALVTDHRHNQINYTVTSTLDHDDDGGGSGGGIAPTIIAPAPISPPRSDYNDSGPQSISPVGHLELQQQQQQQQQEEQHHRHQQLLSQLQMHHQQNLQIKCEEQTTPSLHVYRHHLAPGSSPLDNDPGQCFVEAHLYEGVISLKRKIKEEQGDLILDTTAGLSEESMMDAIDWWDSHTPQSDDSAILS